MIGRLTVVMALWLASAAHAQQVAGIAQVLGSDDADRFHIWGLRAGALIDYESPYKYYGVAAQETFYSQHGWSDNVTGVVGIWRDQQPDTLAGINVEAGAVQVAGHTRPIGDATWSIRPSAETGFEFIGAGGLVDTQAGITQGVGYTFWAASVEQQLVPRLDAIALVGYQPFTDGNDRVHFRARLIWDALPDDGINLQVRWRQYTSSKSDVGGVYFNPDRYEQWLAGVGFRRRFGGWVWRGTLAGGQQYISGTGTQPSALADLNGEGPLAGNVRLGLNVLYTRAIGFSATPNYWYGLVMATLIVPF
jgi:hypothetical protein